MNAYLYLHIFFHWFNVCENAFDSRYIYFNIVWDQLHQITITQWREKKIFEYDGYLMKLVSFIEVLAEMDL